MLRFNIFLRASALPKAGGQLFYGGDAHSLCRPRLSIEEGLKWALRDALRAFRAFFFQGLWGVQD